MLPKHVRYRTAPHPVELTFCNGVYYTAMRLVCQHFFSIFLIYFLVFSFDFLFLFILFSISIFVFMHNLLKNRAVQCRNASNNPLSVLNIFNIIRLFDEIKLPFTHAHNTFVARSGLAESINYAFSLQHTLETPHRFLVIGIRRV